MAVRRVDLHRARRGAKTLLRAARDGDHVAFGRLRAGGRDPVAPPRLADAQRAIARELGAPSWPALMRVAAARAAGEADAPPPDATPEPDAGELDLSGQAAWLRVLAGTSGVATRAVGRHGFAVRTGLASNAENGVVCGDPGEDDVAEVVAWLDGAPAQWLVGPGTTPPDLADRLSAAGARPERTAITMAARIADLDLDGPDVPVR